VNVIVVGAGIVGCAVGYELAARGARVRLLDMRGIGRGATRASAGVLCPHIEGHAAPLRQLGVRSLAMYDDFVARARDEARRPIEYRRNGTLEVALAQEEAQQLKATAKAHARDGIDHQYLEPREALALEPALSPHVAGALLVPIHGYVGVTGFTEALVAAAEARGASVDRGVAVRSVTARGGGVQVDTPSGRFEADAVVVAAGSWSGNVALGEPPVPVKPIRGQLLHLRCGAAPASRVIWGSACYMVPWQDGTLLVGATVEDVGFDERATAAGVHDLLHHASVLLPAASGAAFQGVRVGLRPATADELPIVGRSSRHPGVIYATGHYRNGVLLAPLTAVAVADLVLDGRSAPELAITDPARFGL
jgi:glycine oxidase